MLNIPGTMLICRRKERGMNKPRLLNNAGMYACMLNSTMVTKLAIITINAGIRTLSGIMFLTAETTRFDMIRTKVVAKPIPRPLMAEEVTPKVGHIPRRRTKTEGSTMSYYELCG